MTTSPYTSEALYHFVGSGSLGDDEKTFDVLLKVLSGMCVSHPPHHVGWGDQGLKISPHLSLIGDGLVAPNIVCFCDIPLSSMAIHSTKYGRFGVGIDKRYLAQSGCRPVLYFPYSPNDYGSAYGKCLIASIEGAYRRLFELAEAEDVDEYTLSTGAIPRDVQMSCIEGAFSADFLAFVKAYDYTLPETHPHCYYMEREWRRIGNVMFTPEALRQVVVPVDYKMRLLAHMPALEGKVVTLD